MSTGLYFLQEVYNWFAWEIYESGLALNFVIYLHHSTSQKHESG